MAEVSKNKMEALIKAARGEVASLLEEEIAALRKDLEDGGDDLPGPGGDDDGDAAPPAAEGSAETPSETSAAPGEAPGEASGAPGGGDPMGGAEGGDELEMLTQEFAKMPPDQLAVYYQAIKGAMAQSQGGPPAGGAPPAGGPPGGGDDMMAMKSELKRLTVEIDTLKKNQSRPRIPAQRAVTAADVSANRPAAGTGKVSPERMTRAQITATLNQKLQSGSLSKGDREKITDYYNAGARSVDGIKHLLVGG